MQASVLLRYSIVISLVIPLYAQGSSVQSHATLVFPTEDNPVSELFKNVKWECFELTHGKIATLVVKYMDGPPNYCLQDGAFLSPIHVCIFGHGIEDDRFEEVDEKNILSCYPHMTIKHPFPVKQNVGDPFTSSILSNITFDATDNKVKRTYLEDPNSPNSPIDQPRTRKTSFPEFPPLSGIKHVCIKMTATYLEKSCTSAKMVMENAKKVDDSTTAHLIGDHGNLLSTTSSSSHNPTSRSSSPTPNTTSSSSPIPSDSHPISNTTTSDSNHREKKSPWIVIVVAGSLIFIITVIYVLFNLAVYKRWIFPDKIEEPAPVV